MDRSTERIFLIISFVALLLLLATPAEFAQSGCTGDPCIFETPTVTPTTVPTPTPGAGTPTAAAAPDAVPFPVPEFSVPTSIPSISLPSTPTAEMSLDLPDVPSPIAWATLDIPDPMTNPFQSDVTYTLAISLDLDGSGVVTGTGSELVYGIVGDAEGRISDIVSYTGQISGMIATLEGTNTFTITTAPDWYAPALPRDMASIGWTFELFSGTAQTGQTYSLATWVYMFGQTVSMPFRLAKGTWLFFQSLGPFGLLVIWILVMFPLVFILRILPYLHQIVTNIIAFFEKIMYWIQELWDAIPFKMS